ncbi:MAG: oxygen-dependent coproporphyrinogen oxidase, partial [Kordiimonadaceae bacterium]|nr:oxygen-dependent coproporphyrinogen oxidase [Kordiimonadaceae bacterium]
NKNPSFWASGISVVMHMQNPHILAMHFNTRYICTTKTWFGGGMDITPTIKDNIEKNKFHKTLKTMCDRHNKNYYNKYKKWCDEYFYVPHRNRARGEGGIFYDQLSDNWDKDFAFTQDVGRAFLDVYPSLVRKHMNEEWTEEEREELLYYRGLYAEFNLVYDRGTSFGLKTGGNVEAILMSLPPHAKWK